MKFSGFDMSLFDSFMNRSSAKKDDDDATGEEKKGE